MMESDNSRRFKIKDTYTDVKNYSAGEFGFVKLGTSKSTQEVHCIKVIKKSKFKPGTLEKKLEILHILKSYNNENIARIFDVVETPKKIYIMSEYLKGSELQQKVLKEGNLSLKLSLDIAVQIANALSYYLENNSIFTDLRCEKIVFLDDVNSAVKIIDNGSSRVFDGEFTEDEVEGFRPKDALYMPPEVLKGVFEEKSLSWSLGMILYFMISGKLPYDGPSDPRIENENNIFEERCWEEVGEEVVGILKNMLRKDVDDRLSVSEVEEVMGNVLKSI